VIEFSLTPQEADTRIDKLLRDRLPYCSLSTIFSLLKKGKIRLAGKKCKGKERGVVGDEIKIFVNESELKKDKKGVSESKEEFFSKNFLVISEDDELLVCNKSENIAVHPGKGVKEGQSLIEMAEFYAQKSENKFTPRLVHRLDSDTSGVILIAKTQDSLTKYLKLLKSATKEYLALSHGVFEKSSGKITEALAQSSSQKNGMKMHVEEGGKNAHTEYSVIKQFDECALLSVEIFTGRTHQIRVHLSHIGHPVVGDKRYGDRKMDAALFSKFNKLKKRLYLHASSLKINGSRRKKRNYKADIPSEFELLNENF
jgi:RluA family pseudouridine synthase